jgi:hypothetical protein
VGVLGLRHVGRLDPILSGMCRVPRYLQPVSEEGQTL